MKWFVQHFPIHISQFFFFHEKNQKLTSYVDEVSVATTCYKFHRVEMLMISHQVDTKGRTSFLWVFMPLGLRDLSKNKEFRDNDRDLLTFVSSFKKNSAGNLLILQIFMFSMIHYSLAFLGDKSSILFRLVRL